MNFRQPSVTIRREQKGAHSVGGDVTGRIHFGRTTLFCDTAHKVSLFLLTADLLHTGCIAHSRTRTQSKTPLTNGFISLVSGSRISSQERGCRNRILADIQHQNDKFQKELSTTPNTVARGVEHRCYAVDTDAPSLGVSMATGRCVSAIRFTLPCFSHCLSLPITRRVRV